MLEYGNNIFFLIYDADNIFKGFQVFMVVVHMMVSLFFGRGGGALCQLLQYLPETDSVTLKMAAGHSSETVGHTFTTQCENPQNNH